MGYGNVFGRFTNKIVNNHIEKRRINMEEIRQHITKKPYHMPSFEIIDCDKSERWDVIMASTNYGDDLDWEEGRDLPEDPFGV